MSKHHKGDGHDIEALQKHLTDAKILTEPHAPIHDMLRHAGLVKEVEYGREGEHYSDKTYLSEHYIPAS